MDRIEGRLERMAAAAEASQSAHGVAVLSGQQLRGVETGAKLAGIGGFAAARVADQSAPGTRFSVEIIFPSTGLAETISAIAENTNGPVIDSQQEVDDARSEPEDSD